MTATTFTFTCTWCQTSDHAPSAMQPAWCTECVHATLQGRGESRKAPEPTPPTDDVTTRIERDPATRDYAAYATVDGKEELIGFAPNHSAASTLCRDYRYSFYLDRHAPERAAQIALEAEPAAVYDRPAEPAPEAIEVRYVIRSGDLYYNVFRDAFSPLDEANKYYIQQIAQDIADELAERGMDVHVDAVSMPIPSIVLAPPGRARGF